MSIAYKSSMSTNNRCTLFKMAAQASANDFMAQYKAISSKLKKRFLRKPNVAEASEQFRKLARELKDQECHKYAAFTFEALARCEQSTGNFAAEAEALVEAARAYMKEEQENYDLRCVTYYEHLNQAISCYQGAIKAHVELKNIGLAASLSLELANRLKGMNRTPESIGYYVHAAELLTQRPSECLTVLEKLATCYIEIGDFDRALGLYGEMARMVDDRGKDVNTTRVKCFGAFGKISVKVEIMRVLLLLYLHPSPQKLSADNSQLLEKYAWESTDFDASVKFMDDNLFLLLQSFVMAHQASDLDAMIKLQTDLWPLLYGEQNNIVQLIIQQLMNPEPVMVK